MKKTNKKWLNRLLILVCVIGLLGGGLFLYQWYLAEKYTGYMYYTGKGELDSYQLITDGKGIIVHWAVDRPEEKEIDKHNDYFLKEWRSPTAQNYVFRQNMKLLDRTISNLHKSPIKKEQYWTLSVYKIDKERLKKEPEINLLTLGETYKKGYVVEDVGPVYIYQGKDLMTVYMRPLRSVQTTKVFLNLKTRELKEVPIFGDLEFPLPHTSVYVKEFPKLSINEKMDINQFTVDQKNLNKAPIQKNKKAMEVLNKKDSQIIVLNNNILFI